MYKGSPIGMLKRVVPIFVCAVAKRRSLSGDLFTVFVIFISNALQTRVLSDLSKVRRDASIYVDLT